MKTFQSKHTDFHGIIKSAVKPPPNTFKELINLRSDLDLGALINRSGCRTARNQDNSLFLPTYRVNGFTYNDFGDIRSVVAIGDDRVTVQPGIENDVDTAGSVESNLTETLLAHITAVATNVVTFDVVPSWAKYAIVRNTSVTPHSFSVVKSVSGLALTMSSDVTNIPSFPLTWNIGDVVVFYRSDLQASLPDVSYNTGLTVPITILSRPQFIDVGGKNDVGIVGVSDDLYNRPLWVGRIKDRKYFGSDGFSFNGLYATSLIDDFTYGAFQTALHHLQLKSTSFIGSFDTLVPDADTSNSNWTTAPLFSKVNDYDTLPDTTFIRQTAGTLADCTLRLSNMVNTIDVAGSVKVYIKMAMSLTGDSHLVQVLLMEGSTERGRGSWTISSTTIQEFVFSVFVQDIIDPNNLSVRIISYGGNGAHSTDVYAVKVMVPNAAYTSPIEVVRDTAFALNFSLVEDGVTETKLIYNQQYGKTQTESNTSYSTTNAIVLTQANTFKKLIYVKISVGSSIQSEIGAGTSSAEIVNRRYTELRVYGGAISLAGTGGLFDNVVWRLCRRVPLDGAWVYDNASDTYSIEVAVGNEINTGELYVDRTQQAPNDDLVKKIYYGTVVSGRTFARSDTDKQVVYFSPINANGFAQSSLPSSNYFILSKVQGDIVGLASINDKLVAWKKFSTWTINVSGLPLAVKDDYVSKDVGLASLASVAQSQRLLYFVSYVGVHATDGFKEQQVNLDWIEEFLSYPVSAIEAAIGFYDAQSHSYYLFINDLLWVLDVRTGEWSKEDLIHSLTGIEFGRLGYAAQNFDGQTVFYGGDPSDSQMYEYPRADGEFFDTYFVGFSKDFDVLCQWETNDVEADMDEFLYMNTGELLGVGIEATAGVLLQVVQALAIIKSVLITTSRSEFPLNTRTPMTRYSSAGSFLTSSKVTIREYTFLMKSLKRTGSVKVS